MYTFFLFCKQLPKQKLHLFKSITIQYLRIHYKVALVLLPSHKLVCCQFIATDCRTLKKSG
jgi:hypothetical protein